MKLYTDRRAPNALRVHIFLAEKGIELPEETVDVMSGATRTPAFKARNSLGEVPVLELDDGSHITESLAICRALDGLYPDTPLMGADPIAQGKIEMWSRRMEQRIMGPLGDMGMHGMPFFADKIEQVPAYLDTLPRRLAANWAWLNEELSDGRTYVCEDSFCVADITGMAALYISNIVELPLPDGLPHVERWRDAVQGRSSWPG